MTTSEHAYLLSPCARCRRSAASSESRTQQDSYNRIFVLKFYRNFATQWLIVAPLNRS